jgi:general secretion pathway protein L
VSQNQSALLLRDDAVYWLEPATGEALALSDPQASARLQAELDQRDHSVVFAAPAGDQHLLELAVTPEERRHLDASLPFMLEESLIHDIDDLHFARAPLSKDRYAVSVLEHACMQRWEAQLGELGSRVSWVPEPLLLPWSDGEWTLLVESDSALLRYGRCLGTRMERQLLPTLLAALATEQEPQRIVIYGQDENADRALLPMTAEAAIEWRRGGLAAAMLLGEEQQTPVLDLRQGGYALQLPYGRWWRQWQSMAALMLVALSVYLLAGWLDYRRLERENIALRQEIQAVYRGVNPRGAVVDAPKQLSRQLAALRGGGSGASFTALLAPVGEAIAERPDTVLASLNYSQRSAELRINLLAPSFAEVEELRAGLVSRGYDATLENSSRSGSSVRARMRIGAGS